MYQPEKKDTQVGNPFFAKADVRTFIGDINFGGHAGNDISPGIVRLHRIPFAIKGTASPNIVKLPFTE